MRLVRYLQYWLSGTGAPLHVADFVPETHPIRGIHLKRDSR